MFSSKRINHCHSVLQFKVASSFTNSSNEKDVVLIVKTCEGTTFEIQFIRSVSCFEVFKIENFDTRMKFTINVVFKFRSRVPSSNNVSLVINKNGDIGRA